MVAPVVWLDGRSPDYKAAFLATLGANTEFYDPYQENARYWYKKTQEEVSYVNHAIVNPPVDRDKPLDEVGTFTCTSRRSATTG